MGDACEVCQGKGYIWNGYARVDCYRCDGRGAYVGERKPRRPMPLSKEQR